MDLQIRVHKTDQAFHMQFHKDSMHRSHSSEGISPGKKINWDNIYGNRISESVKNTMMILDFTLNSKLLILFVEASRVGLSRFVPACSQ